LNNQKSIELKETLIIIAISHCLLVYLIYNFKVSVDYYTLRTYYLYAK